MSKGNANWKDVIVQAMNGSNTNTPLLKLARACYKAGKDKEPKTLSAAWLTHAAETAKWALSADAGDQQLLEMNDMPPLWVKAVAEINKSFEMGVDFDKINSYHSMTKIKNMLIRKDGGTAEDPPPPNTAEADDAEVEERDAATEAAEAEEAEDDGDDDDLPEFPADDEGDEAEDLEPEPKKDAKPKATPVEDVPAINPDEKITTEDALFAAAIVAAAIKSGQVLDPDKIVMCPVDLLKAVEMLDALTEGKRNGLMKGINNLVKAQYANHLTEKAEGEQRVATKRDKKAATVAAQQAEQQKNKGKKQTAKKPALVLPADKDAANDDAPPKRGKKEDTDEFAESFADMLSSVS